MQSDPAQTSYSQSKQIAVREMDGEAILLNTDEEVYFSLNKTGLVLYNHLCSGHSFNDAVGAVVDAFEIDHAIAYRDCRVILDKLVHRGILTANSA